MNKFLLGFIITVTLILSCSSLGEGMHGVSKLQDLRFINNLEPTVGLTLDQIIEKYGPASEVIPDDCEVYLFPGKTDPVTVPGKHLKYFRSSPATFAIRDMCLIDDVSVADKFELLSKNGNAISSYIVEKEDSQLAVDLLRAAAKGTSREEVLKRYRDPTILKVPEIVL